MFIHSILKVMVTKLTRFDKGIWLAIGLTCPLLQALLPVGLPTVADLPIHLYRAVEFTQAWSNEVWWPRWAPNLAYGYGYPLFIFAPPLPYLLTALWHGLGFSFESALKILIILTILLYATGMYLLSRDIWGSRQSGLISATAYVYAPFALREVLLYGGNIPQYLAIGLFPWILWAMYRLKQTSGGGWLILASGAYAALILSHLFHALIFTPIALLFGLILVVPSRQIYPLLPLPLGGFLAAFFWLPAFFERYATRAQADIYLQKSPFYLRYPHWSELIAWIYPLDTRAANPYVPLTLGVATLSLVIFSVGRYGFTPQKGNRLLLAYALFVTCLALYLTLPISRPLWETITILQVAEFPWRMLGLANLGLALLAGGAACRWHFTMICLVWQIGSVMPYLYPPIPFTLYGEATLAQQISYEHRSQSIGTTTLGEYLPQTVQQIPTDTPFIQALQTDPLPERLDRASLPPQATATRLQQTAVTHHYQINSPTAFTLRLFQYNYLGWQAWLNGQPVAITAETPTGFITVTLPAGSHDLIFHFGETPLRLMGFALSGLALWVMLILARLAPPAAASSASLPPLPRLSFLCGLSVIIALATLRPILQPLFTVTSPANQAYFAQYPVNISFKNGIRLIGYDLSHHTAPSPGRLQVVLYWQTDHLLPNNQQPFVHLDRLHDGTTAAASTNYTPGDVTTESVLPTFHWDTHRYVRDEHDLIIPANTSPQAYALRVGLLDSDTQTLLPLADGSGDTAYLTYLNIRPNVSQWLGQLPANYTPTFTPFRQGHDTLQLRGYSVSPITSTQLNFTLVWQSPTRPQANYTVFAQLLTPDNQVAASFDSQPLNGAYPTSTWLPGQLIFDPRTLSVPPGQYRLIIGWYQTETGTRLRTDSGADFITLTSVTHPD